MDDIRVRAVIQNRIIDLRQPVVQNTLNNLRLGNIIYIRKAGRGLG